MNTSPLPGYGTPPPGYGAPMQQPMQTQQIIQVTPQYNVQVPQQPVHVELGRQPMQVFCRQCNQMVSLVDTIYPFTVII